MPVDEFDHARRLYAWDKIVLSMLGVWPLEKTYIRFGFWVTYIVLHLTMEFIDFYNQLGNWELMIRNLSESTLESMIIMKLFVVRFSKTLKEVMLEILDGVRAERFRDAEEKKIYLSYNRIAKIFFKACMAGGGSTATLYHLKPVEFRLRSAFMNETLPYVLPYRTQLFFTVDSDPKFWCVFVYQAPMIYIHLFHGMTIGLLFSLIFHVCGELAVLAHRIRNLPIDPNSDPRHTSAIFREISETHAKLIWMAKSIDNTFCMLLLEELVVTTVILCLSAYNVLVNTDMSDVTDFLIFLLYGITMLLMVYGYCFAGEFLINESLSVYYAFYECLWYDAPLHFAKALMIYKAATAKPLLLTGGHFYIFSMAGFLSVLKTSMAYLSMLRAVV